MTLALSGGKHVLCSTTLMIAVDKDNPTQTEINMEEDKLKAMALIMRSDTARYGHLQQSLEEGTHRGRDEYPTTVTAAYDLLQHTVPETPGNGSGGRLSRFRSRRNRLSNTNVSFAQRESPADSSATTTPGRDGRIFPSIICHNCSTPGHYANQCSHPDRRSNRNVTLAQFTLTQQSLEIINRNWLLLDTCSTVSVCCNKALVHDITTVTGNDELTIITNGGSQIFKQTATLNILPLPVHFNSNSLANILSLSDVANLPGARITMDSTVEKAINLHHNGVTLKFEECSDGLYFLDTSKYNPTKPSVTSYSKSLSLLQTVNSNKEFYTKREIKGAEKARALQAQIGWPGTSAFKNIISSNLIRNSGITVDDVSRAEHIYGIPAPLLQGKMTRTKPISNKIQRIPLPPPIQQQHSSLDLFIDFFYVNNIPFLHTKSSSINFLTTQSGPNRTKSSIQKGLSTVIKTYSTRGFNVENIHGDNEFNIPSLHSDLLPASFHIHAANEHCGTIERSIRTMKERCRCLCHAVPYNRYTKLMVTSLVATATYWLNAFPSKTGVSTTLSPANIVLGRSNPDFNHNKIIFGSYALTYTGTTNNMKARSVPAIALGPSNEWGGYYFMSLYTGKRLHSYSWTELPIDQDVIDRVEDLAEEEGQPELVDGIPFFEWNIGEPIDDTEQINDTSDGENENDHMDFI